ncbi:MAG TPA: TMEM175 family protein [Mucilaginibacter sp.]|jgi:uncharacterized membrane protein|nr:TMEM175 family protein [Mucilaginibacter sp.]
MRVRAAKLTNKRKVIEWRSHEPSRLETFSDAVFAFAVTLIIVSLEVPKTFGDLVETLKGTLSFAVCFAILFWIWNNQNLFFRYFGLKDAWTAALNGALLFVVLVYVYPLKFLFNVVFLGNQYHENGIGRAMITDHDVPTLFLIYGLGFTSIFLLFYFMYRWAIKHSKEIGLNEIEVFESKTIRDIFLICSFIGVCSISIAYLVPPRMVGLAGYFYSAIGPAYGLWFGYRGRKRKKMFGKTELHFS